MSISAGFIELLLCVSNFSSTPPPRHKIPHILTFSLYPIINYFSIQLHLNLLLKISNQLYRLKDCLHKKFMRENLIFCKRGCRYDALKFNTHQIKNLYRQMQSSGTSNKKLKNLTRSIYEHNVTKGSAWRSSRMLSLATKRSWV